jgi:fibronectin type 3 domain-containing protein
VSYVIYKGEAGKPLATFRTVAGNENKFSDRQVEVHKTYVYKIKAVFADGTESALSAKVVVEF